VNSVSTAGRELLKLLGDRDQIAMWLYDDHVEQLASFGQDRRTLDNLFTSIRPPDVSEANLYDALIHVIGLMDRERGRRATVVATSCVDTFSKATYQDALAAAGRSRPPIYVISLASEMRTAGDLHGPAEARHTNWNEAEDRVQALARASGGRLYSPKTAIDLSGAYDDMLENLKVRYVITYRSSSTNPTAPRSVRVELINPADGKPLRIVDENGGVVHSTVILQESYTPSSV
jgi:hypothetical protein